MVPRPARPQGRGRRGTALTACYVGDKDALLRRLRRVEGQIRGLPCMVEEERYCIDVVPQVSAATTALEQVALQLEDHDRHCVSEGDASVEELMGEVERFARTR